MYDIFAAFKTAAETGETAFAVYEWSDPKLAQGGKETRYMAIADFTPSRLNPRLSGHRGVSGHMFAVTIVGETTDEVRQASDRLRDRVEGVRLTAGTGETETTPLYQDESNNQPLTVVRDTSNPRLFTAVEIWRCTSTRVPAA